VASCTRGAARRPRRARQGGDEGERRLMVGLIGYPNVGKSSTINALFGAKKTAVAATPGARPAAPCQRWTVIGSYNSEVPSRADACIGPACTRHDLLSKAGWSGCSQIALGRVPALCVQSSALQEGCGIRRACMPGAQARPSTSRR